MHNHKLSMNVGVIYPAIVNSIGMLQVQACMGACLASGCASRIAFPRLPSAVAATQTVDGEGD